MYFLSDVTANAQAQTAANKVRAFWAACAGYLPLGVTITVEPNVAEVNIADGQLTAEYNVGTPPAPVTMTGSALRAAPSGVAVNWRTSAFVNGRRVRGRSFLVPLATGAYDSDGTLTPICLSAIRGAADTLRTPDAGLAYVMYVWHRPSTQGPGSAHEVVSSSVNDRVAILTSRRD
jgi:hypothetical protein